MEGSNYAFETWKSVCAHLKHAIQDYYEASVALNKTLSVPPSDFCRRSREQTLAQLEQELVRCASFEKVLQESKSYLCSVRNTSHVLSPTNSLPTDVLYQVLTLASQPGGVERGYEARVTNLSSVCSAWRQLMVQSPAFWTTIILDLTRETSDLSNEFTRLWVGRSRQATLDIMIHMPYEVDPFPPIAIDSLVSLVLRARTLKLDEVPGHIVGTLMESWAAHRTIDCLVSLDINIPSSDDVASSPRHTPDAAPSIHSGSPSYFCDSLHYLTIRGTWINWPGLIDVGLVELRIENLDYWLPTLQQIVNILSAAPRLHTLSVFHVDTREPSGQLGMVALNKLKAIQINKPELLPAITSTSEDIEAHLHVYEDANLSTFCSFLARTKISRLYLCTDDHELFSLHSFLVPMHHLRVLCLGTITIDAETLQGAAKHFSFHIWPELDEIHLIDCVANTAALSLLASMHPPRTFTIASLINDSSEDGSEGLYMWEEPLTDIGVKKVIAREGGLPTGFRSFES